MPTATPARLQSFRYFDAVDAHPEVTPELVEHASDVLEGFNRAARQEDSTLGFMHDAALQGLGSFADPFAPHAVGLAMLIAADGVAAATKGLEVFAPTGARR